MGRKVGKSFELLQDWEGYYVPYIRTKKGVVRREGKRLCKERFCSDANYILLSPLNLLLQLMMHL